MTEVEYEVDLGLFMYTSNKAYNINSTEMQLAQMAAEAFNIFQHEFLALPSEDTQDGIIYQLPAAKTYMPREKPAPKPKEMTRWDKFAQRKGIIKRKKGSKVFDEKTGEWQARYGKNRTHRNDILDQPIVAAKPGVEDPWAKARAERRERVQKNAKSQERNQDHAKLVEIKKKRNLIDEKGRPMPQKASGGGNKKVQK